MTPIADLSPHLQDHCWMFVLPATNADVAVILRRGPSDWWRLTLWDTSLDRFDPGQWFHGRVYPGKCDVSPDGKLFVYFCGQFKPRNNAHGYRGTWTAVSRPPYFTALALWPIGDTWGGSGIFLDDRTVLLGSSASGWPSHHPDHPPGPLRVLTYGDLAKDDPRRSVVPGWLNGWLRDEKFHDGTGRKEVRKISGDLQLARYAPLRYAPSREPTLYTLYRRDGTALSCFEAHWADWDRRGRLVATVGGHVFAASVSGPDLLWTELAATTDDRPSSLECPAWAQHW